MKCSHRYIGLFSFCAFLFMVGCSTPPQAEKNYIPSLDQISGKWVKADTVAMEPSLRNFRGQAVAESQVDELVDGKPTGRKMTLRAPDDAQIYGTCYFTVTTIPSPAMVVR